MNIEKKRMRSYEQEAAFQLAGALNFATRCGDEMGDARFAMIPEGRERMTYVTEELAALWMDFLRTLPEEQLLMWQRNMRALCCTVGIKRVDSYNTRDCGRYITLDAGIQLAAGLTEHCMMCDKNAQERGQCKLRKALDELCLSIPDPVYEGQCPYECLGVMDAGDIDLK